MNAYIINIINNFSIKNFSIKEFSIKLADKIAEFIGSWTFILIHTLAMILWIALNVFEVFHFDEYPFILLTLFLSLEAAYATPLILMTANRQGQKDREHLIRDVKLDEESNLMIKKLAEDIRIDKTALDYIIRAKEERAEILKHVQEIKEYIKNINQ
jgi:uncharacterized membrane protein